MALIGTQSGNYETGEPGAQAQAINLAKPVLAWYDPEAVNGIHPPTYLIPPRDVVIPDPCLPLLAGPGVLTGQHLVGDCAGADAYEDFPLELRQDTAEVLVTAPVPEIITVEITGYLDLTAGSAEVVTEQSATVTVEATGAVELDGGSADLSWQRNVIIPEKPLIEILCSPTIITGQHVVGEHSSGDRYYDLPLDLLGGSLALTTEILLRLLDSAALELDGSKGVIVNPILMPFDCLDLDLLVAACADLDLAPAAVDEIDLEALVCLEA